MFCHFLNTGPAAGPLLVGLRRRGAAIVTPPLDRDNIDFDQIRAGARQGNAPKFQMVDGVIAPGHMAIGTLQGNLADGGAPPAGGGTVTAVSATVPAEFVVAVTDPTTAPAIAITKATQAANKVYKGPSSGSAAAPTFDSLVDADLPDTAVTPGSYTAANITVNQKGRITAASSGSASHPGPLGSIPGCFIWCDASQLAGYSDNDPVNSLVNFADGPALSVQLGTTGPIYKTGIINSLPVVRFGGSGWFNGLSWDLVAAREMSLFFVMKMSSLSNAYTAILTADSGSFGYYIKSSGHTAFYTSGANYDGSGAYTFGTTDFQVVSVVLGPIGLQTRAALAADATSGNGGYQSTSSGAKFCIGNDNTYSPRQLVGDVAEIVAYRRGLSSAEVAAVESYLKTKYGL